MGKSYEFFKPIRVTDNLVNIDFTVLDKDKKPMQWAGMTPSAEVYDQSDCDNPVFTISSADITVSAGYMSWLKDLSLLDPVPAAGEYDLHFYITQAGKKVLRAKSIMIIEKC